MVNFQRMSFSLLCASVACLAVVDVGGSSMRLVPMGLVKINSIENWSPEEFGTTFDSIKKTLRNAGPYSKADQF